MIIRHKWMLVGLFVLTIGLRLIGLQSRNVWYDEAFSYFLAVQPYDQIIKGTAADTMPPLYYFLLHSWISLGHHVWVLRLLNVLFGTCVVGLAYAVGRKAFGRTAGLLTGLFTAVAPLFIFHSQEMRMYSLLTLGLLGYMVSFAYIYIAPTRIRPWLSWLGLVACGITAMYSHNLAIFTLICPGILYALQRKWRPLFNWLLALAAIGLLTLPWLWQIPGQIEKIQYAFWTPRPGLVQIVQAVVAFISNQPVPAILVAIAAITGIQLLLLVGMDIARGAWKDPSIQFLVTFAILPPLLLFVTSYLMRPVFVPRALMASGVAFYALVAGMVTRIRVRAIGWYAASLFVLVCLAGLPYQISYDSFPRSPFQDILKIIHSQDDNPIIVHNNKLSYFPMHFYDTDLNQVFLADIPGSENDTYAKSSQEAMKIIPTSDIENAVGRASKVDYVVFTEALREYSLQGLAMAPEQSWLEAQYRRVSHQTFNDLELFTYLK